MTTLFAQWIWRAGAAAPPNTHMQFRRTFALAAQAAEARLHISADSRYLLMINGARTAYGPARNYHYRYEFDSYDLRPHLKPGENVIAVDVSHWGEGTFHQMAGRGGLLAQLDLPARGCGRTRAGRSSHLAPYARRRLGNDRCRGLAAQV